MQLRAIPLLGLAAVLAATPVHAAKCPRGTLTGQVTHVRDGDTIVVGSYAARPYRRCSEVARYVGWNRGGAP